MNERTNKGFSKKTAKQVAVKVFYYCLDGMTGRGDPDSRDITHTGLFDDDFETGIEELGFNVTTHRFLAVVDEYDKLIAGLCKYIDRKYYKQEQAK